MFRAADADPMPSALAWATGIDVLPADRELRRGEDYTVVRSPSNPRHHWGNLVIFDDPPQAGDGERWESVFAAELGGEPEIRHRTFAWDRIDGDLGAAREEFVTRGYALHRDVTLRAARGEIFLHPRADREVTVRALDPDPGADQTAWDGVLAVQNEISLPEEGPAFTEFARRRFADLRRLFRQGHGAWYAAFAEGQAVASLGIVVMDGRARYQAVDTLSAYRRRGICSRLLHDAARHAEANFGAEQFVICADSGYHALGLYETVGFRRAEQTGGVVKTPSRAEPPR